MNFLLLNTAGSFFILLPFIVMLFLSLAFLNLAIWIYDEKKLNQALRKSSKVFMFGLLLFIVIGVIVSIFTYATHH